MPETLTKSHFLKYLRCPHNFYGTIQSSGPREVLSQVDMHRIEQGKEFEALVLQDLVKEGFEAHVKFKTDKYFAEADAVRSFGDRHIILYEIKGSTRLKTQHIYDMGFQSFAATEAGYIVTKMFLVLVDKEYAYQRRDLATANVSHPGYHRRGF